MYRMKSDLSKSEHVSNAVQLIAAGSGMEVSSPRIQALRDGLNKMNKHQVALLSIAMELKG